MKDMYMTNITLPPLVIDFFVALIFFVMWVSYFHYSRVMAKQSDSLSNAMKTHRVSAVNHVMQLDIKVAGAFILSNVDKNVSFFASTTLLILASLTGILAKAADVVLVIEALPYAYPISTSQVYLRILLLICIYIYAYFTLTWALRQSSFVSVMIGAGATNGSTNDKAYAYHTAKLMDMAAHSANQGLRAYYFSLAALTWFYHPLAFIFSSVFIIFVLYRREFKSKTTDLLVQAKQCLPQSFDPKVSDFHENDITVPGSVYYA